MSPKEKLFSIASILYPSLNSSQEGISADIFFRGCKTLCPGCHNPELQAFARPDTSLDMIWKTIDIYKPKVVTLMGGEPMDIPYDRLMYLVETTKYRYPGMKMNLYTSREIEEIPPPLKRFFYAIKTGPYKQELRNPHPTFLASSNQGYYRHSDQGWVKVY